MGIFAFQLVFLVFSLVALWGVFEKLQNGSLSSRGALFWALLWIIADGVVLFPESATILGNQLGIGRGADFVLYIAIVVILFVLFRLQVKIESMNRDMTKIVREKALRDKEPV